MILLSGSIAFDYIMNFPGYFEDHILPDKIHVLNVSFLVDSLDRMRGGVAGNIAYNLGLLDQPCRIVGTVGHDFEDYAQELEKLSVDLSGIQIIEDEVTASAYITTDRADNQITGFYPGAMSKSGGVSVMDTLDGVTLAVISPTAPDAMERHVRELIETGTRFVYDPGQQIIALPASAIRQGVNNAHILACNDYEMAMIEDKTGWTREQIIDMVPTVVITIGELGSTIYTDDQEINIPPVIADEVIDPTGAGDAYRAGLLAARNSGLAWESAGRIASTAAAYVVEQKGTQAHRFSIKEFSARFCAAFPEQSESLQELFGDRVVDMA